MRIVLVGDAQSPNTHSVLSLFARAGHEVHLVSLHRAAVPVPGVSTWFLSPQRLLPKWRYLLKAVAARRLIGRLAPDAIVAYRLTGNGLLAMMAGPFPLVAIPTGTDVLGLERRTLALRAVVRMVLARADAVICWAPHMARAVVSLAPGRRFVDSSGSTEGRHHGDPAPTLPPLPATRSEGVVPLLVQPRGVGRERFAPRAFPRTGIAATTVVSTRRLKRSYRHDLLIRSLARLPEGRPWRLVLAGEGSDEGRLRELAVDCGVAERVTFLGSVAPELVAEVLAGGAIYASLIDHDGVSASLLEAMSVGLYPVVGDSDAAALWIKDGSNGRLIASDDPSEVAGAFAAAFDDPEALAGAVEANWRLVAERADARVNGQRIVDFVEGVAQRSPIPARRPGARVVPERDSPLRPI